MAGINDTRTGAEKDLPFLVVGTDRFMSGWGKASGGASYAAWACDYATLDRCEARILARGDMMRVRVVRAATYRPGPNCAHLSIYVYRD